MCADVNELDLLTQREIEARIIAPILVEFEKELGEEKAKQIIYRVITKLAEAYGKELAEGAASNDLIGFAKAIEPFSKDGANEKEVLELNEDRYSFNMTKCKYAEMYKEQDMTELGVILSCSRDFALCMGFNPAIKLIRTQTIMEGAEYCDFRFELIKRED
jgi:hypothetical protein